MKIGELFCNRESAHYPTPDEILAVQIAKARVAHPNHPHLSDAHVLAFTALTLAKNLAERTAERDAMRPISKGQM